MVCVVSFHDQSVEGQPRRSTLGFTHERSNHEQSICVGKLNPRPKFNPP